MNEAQLQDVNEALADLGYLPIGREQHAALLALVPDYEAMLADCRLRGRDSAHWEALRSSQFGASPACDRVLQRLGLDVRLQERLKVLLRDGPRLRQAMTAIAKHGATEATAAQVELVRQAFTQPQVPPRSDLAARIACAVHKVHGARFALAFEETATPVGRPALQVEAAERKPSSRTFDWTQKIAIQLVDHELVDLLAVLRGQRSAAAFGHHGPSRDKFLDVSAQGNGFHVVLRQGKVARAVPVPLPHAFRVTSMVVGLLQAANPHLSAELVLALATAPSGVARAP